MTIADAGAMSLKIPDRSEAMSESIDGKVVVITGANSHLLSAIDTELPNSVRDA
jgi:hypothetical protein